MVDSKIASDQLNRILTFFPRVDNRASLLFTVNSALLGVLAVRVHPEQIQDLYVLIPASLTIGALVYSFGSLYLCAYPNTKGGNGSNVYFEAIAQKTESAFVDGFRKLDEDEWLRDLSAQIWRNSEILSLKYKYLKHSMRSTIFSLLPWSVFLTLTSFG